MASTSPVAHVDDDHRARLGALIADRGLQLAVRQVLDAQVDRQHQVAARAHGADLLDVLHDVAVAILDHALGAVLARQPVIERQLQAFLALVVDAGEADDVPGHFARRVVAAVLAHQVHAGNVQRA